MRVVAALTVLFLLSARGYACSCLPGAFDENEARKADRVFIFRLVEAKAEVDPPGIGYVRNPFILGTVRVVDSLKGSGREVERIRFQNSSCCGIRLDVGHYFIVFTSQQQGGTIDLTEDVIVDVTDKYFEGLSEIYTREGFVGRLNRMLRGELTFQEVLPLQIRGHISTAPPPPPPPPCQKATDGET